MATETTTVRVEGCDLPTDGTMVTIEGHNSQTFLAGQVIVRGMRLIRRGLDDEVQAAHVLIPGDVGKLNPDRIREALKAEFAAGRYVVRGPEGFKPNVLSSDTLTVVRV